MTGEFCEEEIVIFRFLIKDFLVIGTVIKVVVFPFFKFHIQREKLMP